MPRPCRNASGTLDGTKLVSKITNPAVFIFHIIKAGGYQTRVGNAYLHPMLELSLVPCLPLFRRNLRCQDLGPDSFVQQKLLQPPRNVPFARVYGEHLYLPPDDEFLPDFLDQPPLLGVDEVLLEIRRLGNREALPFTVLVRGISVKRAETTGRSG